MRNDIFKDIGKKSKASDSKNKSDRLMNGIARYASFYRLFPHIFCKEYLGINLKIFQQILIYMMQKNHYFMYLASRGQGKTFLTSIFCCCQAILKPGSKIIVASGVKSQAREVVEKIDDLRKSSPNLAREISDLSTSSTDPRVEFFNGSWIRNLSLYIVIYNENWVNCWKAKSYDMPISSQA